MKELAIVAIARIYALVHPYQTLVREIATPTMPGFVTACLQLIKEKISSTPFSVVETICETFTTLIPLYPTVFRPFSSKIRTATRTYMAPTSSDAVVTPESLSRAARRLNASIHFVAAKTGGSDEWAKLVDSVLRQLHSTADQIFRAVDESWMPTSGYDRSKADLDGEPRGGSEDVEQFPAWSGLESGADRLKGLFALLGEILQSPTKAPVTVPLGALMDAVCRVCVIARLSPKTQSWDQAIDTTAGIGRDEKDELWSVMPELHISAMQLMQVLLQTLDRDMIPLVSDTLDHLIRTFKSGMSIPAVRAIGYQVLNSVITIAGPTMPKTMTDMLEPLIAACCRDLQEDAGFLKPAEKSTVTSKDSNKKNNNIAANADLFLKNPSTATEVIDRLESHHREAAMKLLATLLSSLPQSKLKPTIRGILDKTAILTSNRDAMFASVLNPYKDQRGRLYPSILPFLSRQYPHDQGLEILRSNLRTGAVSGSVEMSATFDAVEDDQEAEEDEQDDEIMGDEEPSQNGADSAMSASGEASVALPLGSAPAEDKTVPETTSSNPFAVSADAPVKRKLDEAESAPAKRQELTTPAPQPEPEPVVSTISTAVAPVGAGAGDDSESDDESVHLNMELDDDEE